MYDFYNYNLVIYLKQILFSASDSYTKKKFIVSLKKLVKFTQSIIK